MKFVAALIPSLGMLLVGVVILRAVLYGDRREREALHEWEREQDAAQDALTPRAQNGHTPGE